MARTSSPGEKILDLESLVRAVLARREVGQRLVLTNGCFDLLHLGHVRFLTAAASLGEVLVVGLNSDASVRSLKEPGRPVVQEAERAEVLAALGCVDYVTVFDAPTAEGLVEALRPDFYVKGGDYASRPPPEAAVARALGGEYRTLPFEPGLSTSSLLRQIRGQS